jgi:hypothetical protein
MSTTYVLGAGASYHAGYPLAGQLGEVLHNWIVHNRPANYIWRGCIEELYRLYGGLEDLESILTELDECPPNSRAAALKADGNLNCRGAVRVCLPELFTALRVRPAPLYDRLANERVRPGDTIITFNYDQACERSLKKADAPLWEISDGYGFDIGIGAIPGSSVRVLKLHGSTNGWVLYFGGIRGECHGDLHTQDSRPVILYPNDFDFLCYTEKLCDPLCVDILKPDVPKPGVFPLLITLTRNKRFYEDTSLGRQWEGFWSGLWMQAEHAVQSSEKIVIIGYSFPSADKEARTLLLERSNKNARIEIFCGSSSRPIVAEFASRGFARVEAYGKGFFEEFLNSPSRN